LPGLEETLKRYQEAGLEEKLQARSAVVRESRVFKTLEERLEPFRELAASLDEQLPVDAEFIAAKALKDLPNESILGELRAPVKRLNAELESAKASIEAALASFDGEVEGVQKKWTGKEQAIQNEYEKSSGSFSARRSTAKISSA